MSAALYIVVESADPGFDTAVDGKALLAAEGRLTSIAHSLGVTPLIEFLSVSRGDLTTVAENVELDLDDLAGAMPEEWFEARAGLRTVRALAAYLGAHPAAVAYADLVLEDLRQFERVLAEAERRGLGWHLAVDY